MSQAMSPMLRHTYLESPLPGRYPTAPAGALSADELAFVEERRRGVSAPRFILTEAQLVDRAAQLINDTPQRVGAALAAGDNVTLDRVRLAAARALTRTEGDVDRAILEDVLDLVARAQARQIQPARPSAWSRPLVVGGVVAAVGVAWYLWRREA